MTRNPQLSWRVPRSAWNKLVDFVNEKWGEEGVYIRFELESAMREYLDQDETLAEVEAVIRSALDHQGLSSSSVSSTRHADNPPKKKVQTRVNPDLQDEFKAFIDDTSTRHYGDALAHAINEYVSNGRSERILNGLKRLLGLTNEADGGRPSSTEGIADSSGKPDESPPRETLSSQQTQPNCGTSGKPNESTTQAQLSPTCSPGTSPANDENAVGLQKDSVNTDPTAVNRIIEELNGGSGDISSIGLVDVKSTIANVVNDGRNAVIDAYYEATIDQLGLVEHPYNDKVLLTDSAREEMDLYCDMDKTDRVERLRELIVKKALENGNKQCRLKYTDVQEIFEDEHGCGPSHDYAYDLMELAANENGYRYNTSSHPSRLEVRLGDAPAYIVNAAIDELDWDTPKTATTEADIRSYSSHTPTATNQTQEGAADD